MNEYEAAIELVKILNPYGEKPSATEQRDLLELYATALFLNKMRTRYLYRAAKGGSNHGAWIESLFEEPQEADSE